jgi:hypothetical protein
MTTASAEPETLTASDFFDALDAATVSQFRAAEAWELNADLLRGVANGIAHSIQHFLDMRLTPRQASMFSETGIDPRSKEGDPVAMPHLDHLRNDESPNALAVADDDWRFVVIQRYRRGAMYDGDGCLTLTPGMIICVPLHEVDILAGDGTARLATDEEVEAFRERCRLIQDPTPHESEDWQKIHADIAGLITKAADEIGAGKASEGLLMIRRSIVWWRQVFELHPDEVQLSAIAQWLVTLNQAISNEDWSTVWDLLTADHLLDVGGVECGSD